MKRTMLRRLAGVLGVLAVTGGLAAMASAQSAAVPTVTAVPTLQGPVDQPFVGDKLTTTTGSWTGSPTSYSYQWDRCDATGDRQNCLPITGATAQSYTVAAADVNHTLEALVTATNADGNATKNTKGSGVVAPAAPPTNTARPTISGSAAVGETLTANNGTWVGATSFSYSWLLCDQNGNNCAAISGATGKTYGVRSSDVGHELLARVRAANRFGARNADTDRTSPVTSTTQTQTTTTVVTVPGNKAPTISFISLKRIGFKLYARFRVCDDSGGRVTVTERDNKAKVLSYARHFVVTPLPCGTYARSWILIKRFRSPGRLVVSLRAADKFGSLSRIVSRGLTIR
jgi:hypothetical protein